MAPSCDSLISQSDSLLLYHVTRSNVLLSSAFADWRGGLRVTSSNRLLFQSLLLSP